LIWAARSDLLGRFGKVGDVSPPRLDLRSSGQPIDAVRTCLVTDGGRRECLVGLEYGSWAALPPDLGDVTSSKLEDLAGCIRTLRVRNGRNERGDKLRLSMERSEYVPGYCATYRQTLTFASISGGMIVSVMADAAI
jgi:hypothetical protein